MNTLTMELTTEQWRWVVITLKNAGHEDWQDLGQRLGQVLDNYQPSMANSVHSLAGGE